MSTVPATPEAVLHLLRQLPPRERLRVVAQILPELERDLPALAPALDFWQGVEFATLAEQQAVHPTDDFDALLGGWPDEESIDDFVAAVREVRRHNLARVDAE